MAKSKKRNVFGELIEGVRTMWGHREGRITLRHRLSVKAQNALSRMRRHAAKRGLDRLSTAAIDAEIRAVRSTRKSTKP